MDVDFEPSSSGHPSSDLSYGDLDPEVAASLRSVDPYSAAKLSALPASADALAKHVAKHEFIFHESLLPHAIIEYLNKQVKDGSFRTSGWCSLSTNKSYDPTKGYVQVSIRGHNKVLTLQEALTSAGGGVKDFSNLQLGALPIPSERVAGEEGDRPSSWKYSTAEAKQVGQALGPEDQCSHLCGQTSCLLPWHLVLESAEQNNSRKNCEVWVECPALDYPNGCASALGTTPHVVLTCRHVPPCVKHFDGNYRDMDDLIQRGCCAVTKYALETKQYDDLFGEWDPSTGTTLRPRLRNNVVVQWEPPRLLDSTLDNGLLQAFYPDLTSSE